MKPVLTEVDKLRIHLDTLEHQRFHTEVLQDIIRLCDRLPDHLHTTVLDNPRVLLREHIKELAQAGVVEQHRREEQRQRFMFETRRKLTDAETTASVTPPPPIQKRGSCTLCQKGGGKKRCPKCQFIFHRECLRIHVGLCKSK